MASRMFSRRPKKDRAKKPGGGGGAVESNLVYYAGVAKGITILSDYKPSGGEELVVDPVKCLERIPPLHRRFTHTTGHRTYACLIDPPLVYSVVVDEALPKVNTYGLLEGMREQFQAAEGRFKLIPMSASSSASIQVHFAEPRRFEREFRSVLRDLTKGLTGVPQGEKERLEREAEEAAEEEEEAREAAEEKARVAAEEEDRRKGSNSRSVERSSPVRSQVRSARNGERPGGGGANRAEGMDIISIDGSSALHGHELSMSKEQQDARDKWWRNVRIVLITDLGVCILLFVIWIGICKGTKCMR